MGHRLVLALLVSIAMAACATTDELSPSELELSELDQWASTADGKADLPGTWTEVVAWLRDVYTNRMSAIWNRQEHPASSVAALERIRGLVARAGVTDLSRARFPMTVQRHVAEVDHSELNITLPGGTVVRLVGDPKGAGVFLDRTRFKATVGPRLCLTWSELETAIQTSYLDGVYGVDFVCHTVTEKVLRALDVGTQVYSSQYLTYQSARWIWGPVVPSFNSQAPSDWAVSRACP